MGTPLFALNAERFEMDLVEAAGGDPVNRKIERAGKPGVNITPEEFAAFNPEYIFISGFLSAPVSDYLAACQRLGLSADALELGRVYTMPPGWDFGNPAGFSVSPPSPAPSTLSVPDSTSLQNRSGSTGRFTGPARPRC